MVAETLPIPISALQHYLFCPRQCALIHLEQEWAENRLTTEGRHLHERAHDGPDESRAGVRITRGLAVFSDRLGLTGQCDVVEFHTPGDGAAGSRGLGFARRIFPVEYKRGRPKPHQADEVQLCAQALCLEEMFATTIEVGSLFYGERRRRTEVGFDSALRELTTATAERCRSMLESGISPPAVPAPHCASCSLLGICLPEATRGNRRSAAAWFQSMLCKT